MWTADKLVYRGEDDFVRAYQGSELVWKKSIPNNMIYYTSSDGQVINVPGGSEYWGVNLVSNTYSEGQGIITFDGSLTKIRYNAFIDQARLKSITIPDSVTIIEEQAFFGCSRLVSINIPDGVTTIRYKAFQDCSMLSSVHLSDSLISIGEEVFLNCSSLITITIPDGVTSIGIGCFNGCDLSNGIIVNPVVPPTLGEYSFDDNSPGRLIKVPASSLQDYLNAAGWSEYADYIVSQ